MNSAIIPAVHGDRCTLPDVGQAYVDGRCWRELEPTWQLGCLGCRQKLANEAQLTMHLEAGGRHVIARYCLEHGWEAL